MDDLISRQMAIDVLKTDKEFLNRALDDADLVGAERAKYEWGLGLIESYISDMEELPSAHSEQKDLTEWKEDFKGYINDLNLQRDDYNGIMEYIDQVPTAQPEIVRCKDCKYGYNRLTDANGYNYRVCSYPWGHGMMVEEYGFCKWGKRRE